MPKVVDHDQRRSDILDRCFELFSSKGYGSVRMHDIASSAGISIGTLYHYFPNRERIGQVLFSHVVKRITLEATEMMVPDSSATQRAELLVDFLNLRKRELGQLLVLGIDHHRLYPDSREATEQAVQSLRDVLIERMELDEGSGDRVYSIILGWLVRDVLDPESPPFLPRWIEASR